MSSATIVFSFLGGSAVGAIGAASVTAWHNSAERLKSRMIESAEALLAAIGEVRETLQSVTLRNRELLEAKNEYQAFGESAGKEAQEISARLSELGQDQPAAPSSYTAALRLIGRFIETPGTPNPFDPASRAETQDLLVETERVRELLHEEVAKPPLDEFGSILRSTIRKAARFAHALLAIGDTAPAMVGKVNQANALVARVSLTFPGGSEQAPEIASHASALIDTHVAVHHAIIAAMIRESDPTQDEDVTKAWAAANLALSTFSLAANHEIARWRWPWKKYG